MKTIFIILAAVLFWIEAMAQVPWREATEAEMAAGTAGTPVAVTPRRAAVAGSRWTDSTGDFTTNNLSPFGTCIWSDQGYNTLAFQNGGETVINLTGINNAGQSMFLVPPPGTTNILVTFSARLQSGSGSTFFRFMSAGNANEVYRTNVTLTTAYTNITMNMTEAQIISASSNITLQFYYQTAAPFVVSNFLVKYQGGVDSAFVSPNKRYNIFPRHVWEDTGSPVGADIGKTYRVAWEAIGAERSSPYSYVEFYTDAATVWFEIATVGNTALGTVYPVTLFIDGVYATNILAGTASGNPPYVLKSYPVATDGKPHLVRFYNSYGQSTTAANTLRAIIVPNGKTVSFTKNYNDARMLFIGDSILAGSTALPNNQNPADLVCGYLPYASRVFTQGGASLFSTWYQTNQNVKAVLARTIAETRPSVVWLEHGYNDFAGNVWADTNSFVQAYTNLLDYIHLVAPGATVYAQNVLSNTVYGAAGANAGGVTMAQWRDAIQGATLARSNFVVYVDARNWITTADLQGDGVHPTAQGAAKYAWNITQNVWTNRIIARP